MYQRLLGPIDGSPPSNAGLGAAIRLAKGTGARLRLIHAVGTFVYGTGLEFSATLNRPLLDQLRQIGEEVLKRGREAVEEAGLPVETKLYQDFKGDLTDLVTADAMQWGADLIVLGTHGRRGLRRLVLGSDAEQILRLAPVPVLMVRGREKAAASEPVSPENAKFRRYALAD